MRTLINKEFRTVIKPYELIFLLMPILMLIPSYPYIVGMGFVIQGIFLYFNETRTNNDILFTALLPVSRNRIVGIKHFGVCFLEITTLLIAIPFACLSSYVVNPGGNPVGMDANMTLFGIVLIGFALFNIITLPNYFKTTYKIGFPILGGLIAFVLFYVVFEIIVAVVPSLSTTLDGVVGDTAIYRAIVLIVGVVAYVCATIASYKMSCKNFDKVGL